MNTEELKKRPKPSFGNPPVIEVIAGIQFENSINFKTLDVADFWVAFDKNKFSSHTEMPPLNPLLPDNVHFIEMSDLPKMRRFWFETANNEELIQIQQDRIIFNWKRPPNNLTDKNCYPRFENVMKQFFQYYGIFLKILAEKKIPVSKPSFLELSYINLIDIPEKGLSEIGSIFKDFKWNNEDRKLPAPEIVQHRNFFLIPDLPIRLVTDLSIKQRVYDGKVALNYELSVRGPVNDSSNESMAKWFENARLWITHGFVDTTTQPMHEKWEIEK